MDSHESRPEQFSAEYIRDDAPINLSLPKQATSFPERSSTSLSKPQALRDGKESSLNDATEH